MNPVMRCVWMQHSIINYKICSKMRPLSSHFTVRTCAHVSGTDGKLVYKGAITDLVKGVKLFSIGSSALAFGMQPFVLSSAMSGGSVSTIGLVTASLLAVFTVTTPLMLHVLTRQYVTHLYWHVPNRPHIFTAVTYNIIARPKVLEFHRDDVTVPDIGGFLKSHSVNGRALFLDSRMFTDDQAYITLMGYDKPMDWELPPDYRLGVRNPTEDTPDKQTVDNQEKQTSRNR